MNLHTNLGTLDGKNVKKVENVLILFLKVNPMEPVARPLRSRDFADETKTIKKTPSTLYDGRIPL